MVVTEPQYPRGTRLRGRSATESQRLVLGLQRQLSWTQRTTLEEVVLAGERSPGDYRRGRVVTLRWLVGNGLLRPMEYAGRQPPPGAERRRAESVLDYRLRRVGGPDRWSRYAPTLRAWRVLGRVADVAVAEFLAYAESLGRYVEADVTGQWAEEALPEFGQHGYRLSGLAMDCAWAAGRAASTRYF